jgi:hypothetical protein
MKLKIQNTETPIQKQIISKQDLNPTVTEQNKT